MPLHRSPRRANWRWAAALALFGCSFFSLLSGVGLTERPDVASANLLTKAYYSLGLFVVGGLDIGMPQGGPLLGRIMLWTAFFGAPLLTASAVIEAVIRVMTPGRWQLKRLRGHIIVVGSGELTISYLRVLRRVAPAMPVVVIDDSIEQVRAQELSQSFGVHTVVGDISHDFLLRELAVERAARVVLMGDNDFQAFETASKILRLFPNTPITVHCHNLRFLRAMQDTSVARICATFNSYHLAAAGLVRDHLISHFHRTRSQDVVVLAGFGRFGQTILEELQDQAINEIKQVALIDVDADRRVLVAEEQEKLGKGYERLVFQGDISHPEVWQKLVSQVDLTRNEPTIILGTGSTEDNLRTALWLKRRYPNALIIARTNDQSQLALEVGAEHGIDCISIKQLVEDNLPADWLG
jgi:Trk K+ transport system NAD-binding subunit